MPPGQPLRIGDVVHLYLGSEQAGPTAAMCVQERPLMVLTFPAPKNAWQAEKTYEVMTTPGYKADDWTGLSLPVAVWQWPPRS